MSHSPQNSTKQANNQSWWVHQNGANVGPLSREEVIKQLRSGAMTPDSLICGVGEAEWRPLRIVTAFRDEIHQAPPPPLPNQGMGSCAGEDRFWDFVDRNQQSRTQQAISYRWEAVVCLLLYSPTALLPLSPFVLLSTLIGWVLNTLLYSQARRLQLIVNQPIAGALFLRIMLWVASTVLGIAYSCILATHIYNTIRNPVRPFF